MLRRAFHTPQAYFTSEGYFTNPVRDLFRCGVSFRTLRRWQALFCIRGTLDIPTILCYHFPVETSQNNTRKGECKYGRLRSNA